MSDVVRVGWSAEHADCSRCELRGSCKQRVVRGERPADWQPGGLMIIGEGPGKIDASLLRPFQGKVGQLLDALLEEAGLDRSKVWVTNATLGVPPPAPDSAFHKNFPMAVYSCLPRLEAEIAEARPRVIVTLGQAALVALAGREVSRKRTVTRECTNVHCDPATRKLRSKCLVCASADCSWYEMLGDPRIVDGPDEVFTAEGSTEDAQAADRVRERHGGKCPQCNASITRLRPRLLKCPQCEGKKRVVEDFVSFENDLVLVGRNGVAGAVFRAEELPSNLAEFGVKYVIPTYHPAFCLHPAKKGAGGADKKVIAGQYAARVAVDHLDKARRLLRTDPTFTVKPVLTSDLDVIRAYLAPDDEYAVDIETDSMDGAWGARKITCIGFATADREEALVVDTRAPSDALLDVLQDFFENRRKKKFFHNGQFDRVVIRRVWGMEVLGVTTDTIIDHHALYPDEEHGLGFVAHELLDVGHWKEKKRKLRPGEYDDLGGYRTFEELGVYNAKDTRATALAHRVMRGPPGGRGRLHTERVLDSANMDVRVQEIAIRMELAGMPISQERVREAEVRAEAVVAEELAEMRQIVGKQKDANGEPWTPTGGELLWALFAPDGPLRLEPFAWTTGGKSGKKQPSTAKEALARMEDQHPFVGRLIRYRKYSYILQNYIHGETLRVRADGRLHPSWRVWGTGTTRWTSSPNFQNWSKGGEDARDDATLNLRSMIVAPPGRRIVGADYAALELRIMADLCGDPNLIRRCIEAVEEKKLEPDHDPHAYMAWKTFGAAYLDGDKYRKKALRDVVKRVVYGLNYGAGAATVLEAIYNGGYEGPQITLRMIEAIIATLFREYPGILAWRTQAEKLANQTREVRSALYGSRRIFPLGDVDTTVAYNHPIQASGANIVNYRFAELDTPERIYAVDPTALPLAQVHDAIYYEVDEDRADAVCKVVTETLTCELSLSGSATPMIYAATAEHAATWDAC